MTNQEELDRLDTLLLGGQYTDGEMEEMKGYIKKGHFQNISHFAAAQLRVTLELIQSIRRFDEASGSLVKSTNQLTQRGLWLSGAALALALASLIISIVILVR